MHSAQLSLDVRRRQIAHSSMSIHVLTGPRQLTTQTNYRYARRLVRSRPSPVQDLLLFRRRLADTRKTGKVHLELLVPPHPPVRPRGGIAVERQSVTRPPAMFSASMPSLDHLVCPDYPDRQGFRDSRAWLDLQEFRVFLVRLVLAETTVVKVTRDRRGIVVAQLLTHHLQATRLGRPPLSRSPPPSTRTCLAPASTASSAST